MLSILTYTTGRGSITTKIILRRNTTTNTLQNRTTPRHWTSPLKEPKIEIFVVCIKIQYPTRWSKNMGSNQEIGHFTGSRWGSKYSPRANWIQIWRWVPEQSSFPPPACMAILWIHSPSYNYNPMSLGSSWSITPHNWNHSRKGWTVKSPKSNQTQRMQLG